MLGRVLGGRYRVLSRLGEGGMGAVYLCAHAVLGRRYAVKVLRSDLGVDAELVERFRNEAIAASRIGGENVVDVLDFGAEDDGALYYVMEALEGRSLGTLIVEEGPLEVGRALALLEQICRALGAAHARGVVHRDMKPDNVFVVRRDDGAECAKVIDFGISQVTLEGGRGERLTANGTIIGTPEYMAPEQAAGESVDHRADIYALGVVAYEMLTRTLPIVATTPVATLVAHQTRIPDAPSRRRAGIPPEVDALVLGALAKRPEDRPPSMDALAARIAAIRGAPARQPLDAAPVRPMSRPRVETVVLPASRRDPRRRTRLHGAAAVLGAALLAAVLALAARSWRARPPAIAVAPRGEPGPVASGPPAAPAPPPVAAVQHDPPPAVPGPRPVAAAAKDGPTPSPTGRTTRRPATRRPARNGHLEDPYPPDAGLKADPFE